MVGDLLNELSNLLGIATNIFPDIITIIIVAILFIFTLKGSFSILGAGLIYGLSMLILILLNIDSNFNLIYLIGQATNILN